MTEGTTKHPQKQFGDLLLACLSLDIRRRGSTNEGIHKFVVQAIKDSGYILRGSIPEDILEAAQKKRRVSK